jgi:hypothetical protein
MGFIYYTLRGYYLYICNLQIKSKFLIAVFNFFKNNFIKLIFFYPIINFFTNTLFLNINNLNFKRLNNYIQYKLNNYFLSYFNDFLFLEVGYKPKKTLHTILKFSEFKKMYSIIYINLKFIIINSNTKVNGFFLIFFIKLIFITNLNLVVANLVLFNNLCKIIVEYYLHTCLLIYHDTSVVQINFYEKFNFKDSISLLYKKNNYLAIQNTDTTKNNLLTVNQNKKMIVEITNNESTFFLNKNATYSDIPIFYKFNLDKITGLTTVPNYFFIPKFTSYSKGRIARMKQIYRTGVFWCF